MSWVEGKRTRSQWGSWKLQMKKIMQVPPSAHHLNQMIACLSTWFLCFFLLPAISFPGNSSCLLELSFPNLAMLLSMLRTLQWLPTAFGMTFELLSIALKALCHLAPTPQPSPHSLSLTGRMICIFLREQTWCLQWQEGMG